MVQPTDVEISISQALSQIPENQQEAKLESTERRNPEIVENARGKRPFVPSSSSSASKKKTKPSEQAPLSIDGLEKARKCFKCREAYHPGVGCYNRPLACYLCKEPGHLIKGCPGRKNAPIPPCPGFAPREDPEANSLKIDNPSED